MKKLSDLYLDTRKKLILNKDPDTASFVARNLIAHFAEKTQEQLLAYKDTLISDAVCAQVDYAVFRYQQGEPLAYILGQWDFYGMRLVVNSDVLIPRDDTCAVTALAINRALFLGKNPRVLDLCTGSGCIGLAIASRVKDARVTLADVSPNALAVAKKNIALQKLTGRVSCMQVDALKDPDPFLGKFDMIVSNPPYITAQEMLDLPKSVSDYEPHLALAGGEDGLEFYRSIASRFSNALKPGGFLCFEFGAGQGDAVCDILQMNSYTILERSRDYNQTERALIAQYGRKES